MKIFAKKLILSMIFVQGDLTLGSTMPLTQETHCDITGPDLKSMSLPNVDACFKNCNAEQGCRGWSFISGWNRCFLKSAVKSKSTVRMYSGRIERNGASATVIKQGWDFDDSGTDYRKISPVEKPEDCEKSCLGDKTCHAFVYIQGYRVCWLKKSIGTWKTKVFSCGIRSD